MKPVNRLLLVMACLLVLVVSILVVWGTFALSWVLAVVVAGGVIILVGLSRGRMSSNQDQTISATTNGMPRLDWSSIYPRPMWWLCEIALMLSMAGSIIAAVSPSSSAWSTAGFLLTLLPLSTLFAVVGTLLALRHPWGAFFCQLVERRFAHPRLVGLALLWDGLFLSGLMGVILYLIHAPLPSVLSTADWWKWLLIGGMALFAAFLVAVAPILTVALFDRRL